MKFNKFNIVFLFLLILTIGVVSAEDASQATADTLEIDNSEEIISDSPKTFTDLSNEINKTTDSINLENDYIYNNQSDKIERITFENKTYTINGNSHVIDGNAQVGAFRFENCTITISNLIFKNCGRSPILLYDSNLTTINVTFENNRDNKTGGALDIEESRYTSTNDKFINNYAKEGAAIHSVESTIHVKNSTFENEKSIYWSLIKASDSNVNIDDTIFANITSRYATVLQNDYITVIRNSKFINLHADATAGAIAVKGNSNESLITRNLIENCEFINVSSAKNGGALFLDIAGNTANPYGTVEIYNTQFEDCFSEFGGAILQLGGRLYINTSYFSNNTARYNGGAVYTSYANVTITESDFAANNADKENGEGGALFLDMGTQKIDSSTFRDNVANEGGGIFTYDSKYSITKSQFIDNREAIHTYFDKIPSRQVDNEIANDTIICNDANYASYVFYRGKDIIFNPLPVNGSASDSYFSLRDQGLVTPVKDQGSMGACWAFGLAGAFESAFLIKTNITLDLSENNMQNLGLKYSRYGHPKFLEGSNVDVAASYLLSWLGAITSEDDSYDELGKISSILFPENAYHIYDAVSISPNDQMAIKEALLKYGALDVSIYGANSEDSEYFNNETNALYYYGNGHGNHYVTLVGWNDSYSKYNFKKTPKNDGAWICKNSWGTDWGDEGYFYISYEDKSLNENLTAVVISNITPYDKLYQYGTGRVIYLSPKVGKTILHAINYTSIGGELISAVGTYFEKENDLYTVTIYVNNEKIYTQRGYSDHKNFNSIKLNKPIAIDDNDSVYIEIESPKAPVGVNITTRQHFESQRMYLQSVDTTTMDLGAVGMYTPLKVYAYENPGITKNIKKYYSNAATTFTVENITGESITISIDNVNHTVEIVDGKATLTTGILSAKGHNVITYYNNQSILNNIVIKTTIECDKIKAMTIAYKAKAAFTVRFLDSFGNLLKKTKVSAKFDGKAFASTTTNAYGLLTVTIPTTAKIGKHYIDYVNPVTGEKLRVTITVVSRFAGNAHVNMYYYDGHTYKVRVKGADGKFVGKNQIVAIKIGKKSFKVKTNAKGWAILKIPYTITPGKYVIAATYAGQTVKNVLKVNQVLKSQKTYTTKKSGKYLILKATLKKGKVPIKNKIVKFKLNGKTYNAKTNKYGIAKIVLKKAVLNKLKVRKYVVQSIYLKDIVKSTLIVRR